MENKAGPTFQGFIAFKGDEFIYGKKLPYLEWAEMDLAKLIVENCEVINWGMEEKTYDETVEHSCDIVYVSYLQNFLKQKGINNE